MSITEIQDAITQLSETERRDLAAWLARTAKPRRPLTGGEIMEILNRKHPLPDIIPEELQAEFDAIDRRINEEFGGSLSRAAQ